MNPACIDQGVGIIPWSPLARGFLAGNRKVRGEGPTKRAKSDNFAHEMYYEQGDFEVLDAIEEIAEQHDVKPAQIALAWLLHRPGITAPIIGASKMYQLDEAIAAVEIKLSEDEMKAIQAPYQPHPVLGHS